MTRIGFPAGWDPKAGDGGQRRVDAAAQWPSRSASAMQINYTYNMLTWTDGVVPPPLVRASGVIDSPYRGLNAFDERDAAFFFGRETAATQVLELMSRQLDEVGLLVVSGASGAGKSSLLQAGVLPRMRGAGLASAPGSAYWPCLLFTGSCAVGRAGRAGCVTLGAAAATVRRGLDADPAGFALTARQGALAQLGGPAGDPNVRGRGGSSRGCCWSLISSSSYLPNAPTSSSGERSSLPCTQPPVPCTERNRHLRLWWCWGCVLISRPAASSLRS